MKYVETYDMTLTPDGQAREELFVKDKLHFNAEGYQLFAERVGRRCRRRNEQRIMPGGFAGEAARSSRVRARSRA